MRTATFRLSAGQLWEATTLLAPAEAATHWEHPNLWTWRQLLAAGDESSVFLAFFVADPADPTADNYDANFRVRLARQNERPWPLRREQWPGAEGGTMLSSPGELVAPP